jgi:ribosomal protein S18 acetylase RimI-like enzyme
LVDADFLKMNNISFRSLFPEDYESVIDLWKNTESVNLTRADEHDSFALFLERNPGLSFVAESNENIIGTLLCGSDGRRGYLYHLAVQTQYRRNGIGSELINKSLAVLKSRGIEKCHLFVFENNDTGCSFYSAKGWKKRDDILVYSKDI